MSLSATPQTPSSPVTPTGRSLLSRLTSPLRSRTRNLADFHIRPLEPHRVYSPGDVVKGLVVLTVAKPIRITHLTVALHGFVRVFRSPNVRTGQSHDPSVPASDNGRSQCSGNGQVSLFQDEVPLCGEGRLEIGVYEFEFELEFPKKGLPTSIEFERGSISYTIRATITRPTSIAATSSRDQKISLIETVDIGTLIPPNPCTISLKPISKKTKISAKSASLKGKTKSEKEVAEAVNNVARTANSPVPDESASQRPSSDHTRVPRSPVTSDVQSETSGESVVSSNSTGLSFRLGLPPSVKSVRDSHGDIKNNSIRSKTITTTIELLKAGCLPGDSIPLRVTIQHTKPIRSLRGIIITLYRQGRIDSAPPLSLFMDVKGKAAEKLKHEEYYPKSRTGLGGLSLSSAGSSSVFRKDLFQTFAPIIIDPSTLSTVVPASIRVPENAFPTITGVPGEMISFRYHIEVVVDLGGKLGGQSKHISRLGMMSTPSNFINSNHQMNISEAGTNTGMLAAWGSSIVDTDHIRREKGVVACLFEIIVGTTDSARQRGRCNTSSEHQKKYPTKPTIQSSTIGGSEHETLRNRPDGEIPADPDYSHIGGPDYRTENSLSEEDYYGLEDDQAYQNSTHQSSYPAPVFVPMPEIPAEGLTEKQRIRLAEERLLPSQPPQDDDPSSSRTIIPSAPEDVEGLLRGLPDDADNVRLAAIDQGIEPGNLQNIPDSSGSPLGPDLEDLTPQATTSLSEDKQELERQRLMMEASSPSDFPDDRENAGRDSSAVQHEPTAPILTEEDDYGSHYVDIGQHRESLPRYER